MKLALRSVLVLVVGCMVAVGGYLALGALPSGALPAGPHAEGARVGEQPPSGHGVADLSADGATNAQPPAGASRLQGGRPDRRGGPEGRGGRAGHGGGPGVLGLLMDAVSIAIVTAIVVLLGRAVRSVRGRDVGDPASEPV